MLYRRADESLRMPLNNVVINLIRTLMEISSFKQTKKSLIIYEFK